MMDGITAAQSPTPLYHLAPQVEDDENDPDWLAVDAVVDCVKVPLTVAVVPDARLLNEKVADPLPPETSSSCSSVSSIMISIVRSSMWITTDRGKTAAPHNPRGHLTASLAWPVNREPTVSRNRGEQRKALGRKPQGPEEVWKSLR